MRRVYKIVVWRDGRWWSLNRAIFPSTHLVVPYPVGRSAYPLPGTPGLLAFADPDAAMSYHMVHSYEWDWSLGELALWEALTPSASPLLTSPISPEPGAQIQSWPRSTVACPFLILLRPLAVYFPETGKVWRAEG